MPTYSYACTECDNKFDTVQSFSDDALTDHGGDGPPILFLHNGGTSSTIWRHQLEALSAEHRCIAVDLPGFGCTPRPGDPLDHAGLVAITAALLEHLDVHDAVVVGNCMGANLAVHLATSRPDLVDALVIVNPLTEATFDAGGHTAEYWAGHADAQMTWLAAHLTD